MALTQTDRDRLIVLVTKKINDSPVLSDDEKVELITLEKKNQK